MNRLFRVFLVFFVVAVFVSPSVKASAYAGLAPDIVVFMVDDLGAIDERILSRLPNISDFFLQRGLRFDQAYDETPLCCPGRASFLTGMHTRRHGVIANDATLLDPSRTIATALHDVGYYTIHVGKYLNGVEHLSDLTPPGWDQASMLVSWRRNVSSRFVVQGSMKSKGFSDRFTADRSLKLLQAAPSDRPVFMWLTPHAPHFANGHQKSPWITDVEKRYLNDPRCSNIERWSPPTYRSSKMPSGFPLDEICRSLLTTDDMVGAIKAEMDRQGRDPIYVFTSDNGMSWGRDGYPLKNVPQSGRVPLYFSGHGIVAGSTSALVSNIDLAPTLVEFAGTSMPWADGRSYSSVLLGTSTVFNDWILEDHPIGGTTGTSPATTGPWWGIRTPEWHFVHWGNEALYYLPDDPWEQSNLASAYPDKVAELKAHRP